MIDINSINNGKLLNGDALNELKRIPSESIDGIVTDPPYGMGFYNLNWDNEQPSIGIWQECFRVLKPGAFAFIMASVRQDLLSKMIFSLEKAGFKMDFSSLYWTYTTGFPKAQNIAVAIDKKLGVESKVVQTRSQERVKFKQMRDLGRKGKFSDPARIEYTIKTPTSELGKKLNGGYSGFQPRPAVEAVLMAMKPLAEKTYVDQAIDNAKGLTFLGDCRIPYVAPDKLLQTRFMSNLIVSDDALDNYEKSAGIDIKCVSSSGKSYRFSLDAWAKHTLPHLLVEKAPPKEKELGLENMPYGKSPDRKNIHPTVKPLKLMAYLIVLGSREGNLVLDPFCGSGTTCLAARLLSRKFIGIEIEKEYYDIACNRLRSVKLAPEADALNESDLSEKDKPGSTTKISELESMTLRFNDPSVVDLSTIGPAIDNALGNNPEALNELGDVEITMDLKSDKTEQEGISGAKPSLYQQMISRTRKLRTRRGKPKVISVSRRTDIPALYSDWFFNRIKEGVALVKTKVDSSKIDKVFLEPEDVRCFVFWTKNPAPMLDRLNELDRYKYYFHFTLTPCGQDIEPNLPPKKELIQTFIRLSEKIGPKRVIWRYDPILLTDTIDLDYHKKKFEDMAKRLHQYTERCTISFIETRKIPQDVQEHMGLKKIDDDMKWELASWIQFIAEGYGLKVEACAQKIDFSEIGITSAKCVNPCLIGEITGEPVTIAKDMSQRKKCGCVPSKDIGTNDTCTHGCLYCYATKTAAQARLNYHLHKSDSPAMTMEMEINGKKEKDKI